MNTLAFLGPLEAGVLVLVAEDEAASSPPLGSCTMVSPSDAPLLAVLLLAVPLLAVPLLDSKSETRCTLRSESWSSESV